jgi:hypothetical protein
MTPLHVHFAVDDLAAGVHFYSMMFASEPAVLMPNYAKWILDDPRVAFAISRRRVTSSMHYAASVRPQKGCIPKT